MISSVRRSVSEKSDFVCFSESFVPRVEQEKMSVINGLLLAALNDQINYGTKDDGFRFDQKSDEIF